MIAVRFVEPADTKWVKWRKRCIKATELLTSTLTPTGEIRISEKLYKSERERIWQAFNGKCAYCEVLLTGNQRGDVEHWRPKKAVTDEEGNSIRHPKTGLEHRGYYWLAYDWRNLLPSCVECNQPGKNAKGETLGKRNMFPVEDEELRAYSPGEEVLEKPLLLHPFLDTPENDLVFDRTGVVGGTTVKGLTTVRILELNRDGLLGERKSRWGAVMMTITRLMQAAVEDDAPLRDTLRANIDEYERGVAPYSALGRLLWKRASEQVNSLLKKDANGQE